MLTIQQALFLCAKLWKSYTGEKTRALSLATSQMAQCHYNIHPRRRVKPGPGNSFPVSENWFGPKNHKGVYNILCKFNELVYYWNCLEMFRLDTVLIQCTNVRFILDDFFCMIGFQNDLHRAMQRTQSALSQQLLILSATILCLLLTR